VKGMVKGKKERTRKTAQQLQEGKKEMTKRSCQWLEPDGETGLAL